MNYLMPRVAVKYGVFTLCCRKLTERLPKLDAALVKDPRLSDKKCYDDFDDALCHFLERSKELEPLVATRQFVDGWRARIQYYQNPKALPILIEAADSALEDAELWDYSIDIEHWHQIARSLALQYFATTSCPEIKQKLNKQIRVVYLSAGGDGYSDDLRPTPFGREAPVSYWEEYKDEASADSLQDVILVRSESARSLALYLCYTFAFLHEYTAHIFANDYQVNDVFNDGWMLFAAFDFLDQQAAAAARAGRDFPVNRAQVNVFEIEFLRRMRDNDLNLTALKGYSIAQQTDVLLKGQPLDLTFERMTHELAAFVPSKGEPNNWPTDFIYRLGESLYRGNHQQLLRAIGSAKSIRDLYGRLQ
jgi:hypothetical protein